MHSKTPYEIGAFVTQAGLFTVTGDVAVFEIIGYWRGDAKLQSLDNGTTHCAALSELTPHCGCQWNDGSGQYGPKPYIEAIDPACAEHAGQFDGFVDGDALLADDEL